MMDDDFFLTEPWTLRDFMTPDGGQILTGDSAGTSGISSGLASRFGRSMVPCTLSHSTTVVPALY
jgi:hypothetical protein